MVNDESSFEICCHRAPCEGWDRRRSRLQYSLGVTRMRRRPGRFLDAHRFSSSYLMNPNENVFLTILTSFQHISVRVQHFNLKCDRSWSLQCGCQELEGVKRLVARQADLFSNLQTDYRQMTEPDRVASCNAASLQFVVTAALLDFHRIVSAFASSRGTRPVR